MDKIGSHWQSRLAGYPDSTQTSQQPQRLEGWGLGEEGGKKERERGERESLDEEGGGKGKRLWRRQEPQRKKVNERSGRTKRSGPGAGGKAGRRARRPPLPAALSPPARSAMRRFAAMLGGQAPAAL